MTKESELLRLRLLKPGNYHCFFYENESEANTFAVSFVRQGLSRREKIICLTTEGNSDNLLKALAEGGIDIYRMIETGQLRVETGESSLYNKMAENPADFNVHIFKEIEEALSQGYQALRVSLDVTGKCNGAGVVAPDLAGSFTHDSPEGPFRDKCLMVFMYGLSLLPPEALFRVLAAHPSLIIGDSVYSNFLFKGADKPGNDEAAILKVENLLDLLRDYGRLEETIKKGGEALKASEDNYRSIFESAANLIATVDKKGKIIDCNSKIEEVLGYTREEVVGRTIATLFHPEYFPGLYEILKEVIKKGSSYNKQYKMVKKDGSTVYVSVNTTPLKNDKGKITKVVSIVEDITERKGAEEALFESEKRYRQLIEILPDAVLTLAEGRIIFANGAAYSLLGLSHPRDLIGRRMDEFVDSRDIELLRKCFETIERGLRVDQPVQVRMNCTDGSVIFIEWTGTSFAQKEQRTIILVGRDITGRRLAEQLLRESEERYRIAIENSNDGVAILRGETYLYINKRLAEIFGYRNVNEVLNRNIAVTIHPDDREMVLAINHMRQEGGNAPSRYEFKGLRKDGTVVYIEVSANPITYEGTTSSLIYLRDITTRKELEERLKSIAE